MTTQSPVRSPSAKAHARENVRIRVKNADGSIAKVWQPNEAGFAHFKATGTWLYDADHGSYQDSMLISNLVTDAGFAGIAQRIGGIGSVAAFTYVAIGTGTTAANAADTTLETEITTGGGARSSVTPTSATTVVTNDTIVWTKNFTFSASFALTEVGILNAASAGILLGRRVYPAVNVTSGMQVEFEYSIDLS